MIVNKAQEASVFNDMKIYIFLALGFITFIALLVFISVILRKLSEKIIKLLKKIK